MSDVAAPALRFYSVRQIAEVLGVCTKTVRNWIKRRDLRAFGDDRLIRIAETDFQAFLEQRRK